MLTFQRAAARQIFGYGTESESLGGALTGRVCIIVDRRRSVGDGCRHESVGTLGSTVDGSQQAAPTEHDAADVHRHLLAFT